MLEQRIQQQFFESADLQYQAADALARPILQAVQALEAGLTAGGRLLVAGSGAAGGLAAVMVHALVNRFERERPGLGAMVLGADAALAAATDGGLAGLLARQVHTLGQPGDLLLLIDPEGDAPALLAAAAAAQAKDMTIIALTGPPGGALAAALDETDVLVAVPHPRRARVLETHLLVLHCLCDAIDLQLLGDQDPE
jgi:D-sedoheptulose 7-phosphate isomerase